MKKFKRAMALVMSITVLLTSIGLVSIASAATATNITYTEDLDGYNSDNAVIGTESDKTSHIWAVRGDSTPKLVAENDMARWELSGIHKGGTTSLDAPMGHAWVQSDGIGVFSRWQSKTTINLNLKNYDIERLNSFSASLSGSGGYGGIRFMVSEDEKTYYEIGRGHTYTNDIYDAQPYIKKSVNGTENFLVKLAEDDADTSEWKRAILNIPSSIKITDIDYETNTISYQIKIDDDGKNIHVVFEGSFVDEELADIAAKAVYPVAVVARGTNDGNAKLRGLTLDADVKLKDHLRYDYWEEFTDLEANANNEVVYSGSAIASGTIQVDNGNTDTETRLTGEAVSTTAQAQKLFSANGADYILSKRWVGAYGYQSHPGGAGYYTTGDSLYVRDRYAWITAVNTDLGDNNYDSISEITATAKYASKFDIGHELKFMVSANEESFYFIGVDRKSKKLTFGKKVNNAVININTADDVEASEGVEASTGNASFVSDALSNNNVQGSKRFNIEIDGNTITWTVIYGSGIWTGSYTDNDLPIMLANTRYPTAFSATGDGYALWDNVGISYVAAPTPDFADDFSTYTADNAVIGSENALTATPGAAQTVATGNGYTWELSGVMTGNDTRGKAYVSADGKAHVKDRYQGPTAVNLNLGDITYNNISRISGTTRGVSSRTGIRFMISGNEKAYYEVGIGGDNDKHGVEGEINNRAVYLLKCDGSTTTMIDHLLKSEWTSNAGFDQNWTIVIEGNKIKASVLANGKYWSTEYVDADLPKMLKNTVYPVAFIAKGDGDSSYDNLTLNYSATPNVPPVFEDDFSNYAEADCPAYGKANYIITTPNIPQVIAKNDSAVWSTSGVCYGQNNDGSSRSGAALDNSAGRLYYGDIYQKGSTINLTPASRLYDINKVTFTSVSEKDVRTGARLFISGNEKSYYEIGYGRGSDNSNGTSKLLARTPYIKKQVNGEEVFFKSAPQWSTAITTAKDWTVTVSGNKITVYVESGSESWIASYEDAELTDMINNAAYPFAAYVLGDGEGRMDNVKIYGKEAGDLLADNGDGTFTVNVLPVMYDVTKDSIDVVTVCYDANGDTFNGETITDMTKEASFTYDVPASGKYDVFLFDGSHTDGLALEKKDYKAYKINESIPTNRIKIACIGDSLTAGHGSSNNITRSYPGNLQKMLGAEYEVKNFGLGGRTLMNNTNQPYMAEQYFIDSQSFQPDIVTIMLGTNDRGASFSDEAVRTAFYNDYKTMITTYQGLASNPEVILFVPPISGTASSPDTAIAKYERPIIKQLAKEFGCRVVDMNTLITDYSLMYDALHFRDNGYELFAEQFYNAITDKIEKFDVTASQITINPTAEIYGDVYAAYYKGDELISVKKFADKELTSAVDTVLDISTLSKTGADRIKLMAWNGLDEIAPVTEVLTAPVNAVVAGNGEATVYAFGAEEGKLNTIQVLNGAGEMVYIDQVASDYNNLVSAVVPYAEGYTVKVNGKKQ